MAIVLKKQVAAEVSAAPAPVKPTSKLQVAAEQQLLSDFAGLIDEVGALEVEEEKIAKQIKKLQESLAPLRDKRKELDAKVAEIEADADAVGEELGARFRLEWGKQGTKREIVDMPRVKAFLGDDLFMQLATVRLGDIDDYLTPPQKAEVIEEGRIARKYKIAARA
jgi:hypothetical protein